MRAASVAHEGHGRYKATLACRRRSLDLLHDYHFRGHPSLRVRDLGGEGGRRKSCCQENGVATWGLVLDLTYELLAPRHLGEAARGIHFDASAVSDHASTHIWRPSERKRQENRGHEVRHEGLLCEAREQVR